MKTTITLTIETDEIAKPDAVTSTPEQQARPAVTPPAPGQHWPEQGGTYIGIASAEGDLPARHLIVLDAETEDRVDWKDAKAWAESHGDGARLPTQLEAMLAFTTSKHTFKPQCHWTSTQLSPGHAFIQDFDVGSSYASYKDGEYRARAFRAIPL